MNDEKHIDDPKEIENLIKPFIEHDLLSWSGLVYFDRDDLIEVYGEPHKTEEVELGYYPATRLHYKAETSGRGFSAFFRDDEIVLVQVKRPPPISILDRLGMPDHIKPNEIFMSNAYVHEYVYCQKGLVLSVTEPYKKKRLPLIVRCRGIHPIDDIDQFGPDLYKSFEEKIKW